MPAKKKAPRPPKPASKQPADDEKIVEQASTLANEGKTRDRVASDAWTDEQETILFRSMIQCKPVGMHKHFRMVQIWDKMRVRGYNGYLQPQHAHTTIPGIWTKLGTLYNLEDLDTREDAVGEQYYPFTLPDQPSGENEGYWDLKFARRIDPAGPSSPTLLPHQLTPIPVPGATSIGRQSTMEDIDGSPSSPASNAGRGTRRGTRGARGAKGARASRLVEVAAKIWRQSQSSPSQATEDDQHKDEEAVVAAEVDEDGENALDEGKASKASVKGSKRRNGRKK